MGEDIVYIMGDQGDTSKDQISPKYNPVAPVSDAMLSILKNALGRYASDIHLQVGSYPIFRINGTLTPFTQTKPVTSEFTANCVDMFLHEKQKRRLFEERQGDCSVTLPNFTHRFRINFFFQRNHLSCAFRANPVTPPTMEQLGLPPLMEAVATLPHGLVLITGATGAGKTTTLAAVVNYMNRYRNLHIITISDPIEYVHKNEHCMISQREIGNDAISFPSAIRAALREDPDVIVVEEMRDLESISTALTAAETGHLVFATLHTNDAVQTIDRLIDVYPTHQQNQIRLQLAMTLQAVFSQVLIKKKDSFGRIAVFETMPVTTAIRNLIRENKTVEILNVMSMGRVQGMSLRNDVLRNYVQKGLITQEDAEACFLDNSLLERKISGLS
jgi:twitching motility protein PilT